MALSEKEEAFVTQTLAKVKGLKRNLKKVGPNSRPILESEIGGNYRSIAIRHLIHRDVGEAKEWFQEARSWYQLSLESFARSSHRIGRRQTSRRHVDFARWNLWTAPLDGNEALRAEGQALSRVLSQQSYIEDRALPILARIVLEEWDEGRRLWDELAASNKHTYRPHYCEWETGPEGQDVIVMKVGKPETAYLVEPARLKVLSALMEGNRRAFKVNLAACLRLYRSILRDEGPSDLQPYMEGLVLVHLAIREGLGFNEGAIPRGVRKYLPWIWEDQGTA